MGIGMVTCLHCGGPRVPELPCVACRDKKPTTIPLTEDGKPDLEEICKTMTDELLMKHLQSLLDWQREQDAKVADKYILQKGQWGERTSGDDRAKNIAQAIRNQG